LLKNYSQHRCLLANYRCPGDQRIQDFLNAYLHENGIETSIGLPDETFVLEHKGLARELTLPFSIMNFIRSMLILTECIKGSYIIQKMTGELQKVSFILPKAGFQFRMIRAKLP
jgi:hypothetical protein